MTIHDHVKKLFTISRKNKSMPLDVRLLHYVVAYGLQGKPTQEFIDKCEAIERENIEQRKENKKRHDATIVSFNKPFLFNITNLKNAAAELKTQNLQSQILSLIYLFTKQITHYTHTLSRP